MRIFLATQEYKDNPQRQYAFEVTQAAYKAMGVNIFDMGIMIGLSNFDRYYEPEERGWVKPGDIYAVVDDDCVPGHRDMLAVAESVLRDNPDVGMVGFLNRPRVTPEEVSGYYKGSFISGEKDGVKVWEFDHSGGIRVVRGGIIKKPSERPDYKLGRGGDRIFCDEIRKAGYKVVVLPDYWLWHLGETFSTIWAK